MWRNQKFCQIWRNFKILHMTDVKKSEIYPVFGCEICFVAIYAIFSVICFVAIYALLRGKKLSRKLYRWRKNDKYEVCTDVRNDLIGGDDRAKKTLLDNLKFAKS